MTRTLTSAACILFLCTAPVGAQDLPKPLITDLKKPTSVAVGPGGKTYVCVTGADGQGEILRIEDGKTVPFATGLTDARAMIGHQDALFVTGKDKVWRVDKSGMAQVAFATDAFPAPPVSLGDIAIEYKTSVAYVVDEGAKAIYRLGVAKGGKGGFPGGGKGAPVGPAVVLNSKNASGIDSPYHMVLDGAHFLLVTNKSSGELFEVNIGTSAVEKLADAGSVANLAWDAHGRLYLSDAKGGKILGRPRPDVKPIAMAAKVAADIDLCVDSTGTQLVVADLSAGSISQIPLQIPGYEVEAAPLKLQTAIAFPDVKWAGFNSEDVKGKPQQFRPINMTHAGDGTNRIFVGTQQGLLHVLPNDQKATKSEIFLDFSDRVLFTMGGDERGFLGLAFHPKYKQTGEFFVFYTPKAEKMKSIVARFRVSKDNPNKADLASEEILLKFDRPFDNHNGGTIAFGPDGYLYIAIGDGGSANDPKENGQNLNVLQAKILRIDIDHHDEGMNYAIPKDNPYAGKKDARGEVWAWGMRNPWRMAFDPKTGVLWEGQVGQELWEEINLIQKGGNYGWSRREGFHPFSVNGVGANDKMVDPIWEYHHQLGNSITGGGVYRGPRLPELDGAYVYADYVSGRIWALRYDEQKKRVVANQQIKSDGRPIYSFGQDEQGELYFLRETPTGQSIYWFTRAQ